MKDNLARFCRRLITSGADKDWRVQFVQHLWTGVVATVAHYIAMWLALSVQFQPVLATTVGFTLGATTRFLFSFFHIFEPQRSVVGALPRFILVLGFQMGFNAALLAFFLFIGLTVWPAQVLTTALLTILNFLTYKHWVFK